METQLPKNFPLIDKIRREAVTFGLFEAFLEAVPQMILQLSIVLRTGFISKLTHDNKLNKLLFKNYTILCKII
jgi:hypothetical protein